MGRRAAARFEQLFTSEQMAANDKALYHDLVARHATGSSAVAPKQTSAGLSETTHRSRDWQHRSHPNQFSAIQSTRQRKLIPHGS
jgi:hypothetical protein